MATIDQASSRDLARERYLSAPDRQSRRGDHVRRDPDHQSDAVLHFDRTPAVEPLEPTASWARGEAPETYPTALLSTGADTRS